MKKLSETLKENGIAFDYPIYIKDAYGSNTYYESEAYWEKRQYDADGSMTYYEDSHGYWCEWEHDANGSVTYFEDSDGYWYKREYDADGKVTYYKNSDGVKRGTPKSQSCAGKVIEVDGKKYKLTEL